MLKENIVLASNSPRRAEILRAVGWPFETVAARIDEARISNEPPVKYVERVALAKAEAVAQDLPDRLVLGADTVVLVDDHVLGKPCDSSDCRRMLRLLSGRWHEVLTGVALVRAGDTRERLVHRELTRVRFSSMSKTEIDWYIQTGEPMDKAGAYAIQGKAALFVKEIRGDYFNIVGLPVRLVFQLAEKMTRS